MTFYLLLNSLIILIPVLA